VRGECDGISGRETECEAPSIVRVVSRKSEVMLKTKCKKLKQPKVVREMKCAVM
jgi:hypothetical protein